MKQDQIGKLVVIAIVIGLIAPFIIGGALSLVGMAPFFMVDGEAVTLTGALSSGAGISVYAITALIVALAVILPVFLMGSAGSSSKPRVQDDEDADDDSDADDDRETGEVKWFNPNKGFGFITRNNGDEIFVHFRSIRGRGHRSLRQGQSVRFRTVQGEKGLQAEDVSTLRQS